MEKTLPVKVGFIFVKSLISLNKNPRKKLLKFFVLNSLRSPVVKSGLNWPVTKFQSFERKSNYLSIKVCEHISTWRDTIFNFELKSEKSEPKFRKNKMRNLKCFVLFLISHSIYHFPYYFTLLIELFSYMVIHYCDIITNTLERDKKNTQNLQKWPIRNNNNKLIFVISLF